MGYLVPVPKTPLGHALVAAWKAWAADKGQKDGSLNKYSVSIGLQPATLSRIISGKRKVPSGVTLAKVARALGTTADAVLAGNFSQRPARKIAAIANVGDANVVGTELSRAVDAATALYGDEDQDALKIAVQRVSVNRQSDALGRQRLLSEILRERQSALFVPTAEAASDGVGQNQDDPRPLGELDADSAMARIAGQKKKKAPQTK